MRILITVGGFPPERNGVANVAHAHATTWANQGHDVTVATTYNHLRDGLGSDGPIRVVPFKISGNWHPRTRYSGELHRYMDFVASFDCDVICCHAWMSWASDLTAKVSCSTRAKKVMVSHGLSASPRSLGSVASWIVWQPYLQWIVPRMIEAFDHIVFLTDHANRDFSYDRMLVDRIAFDRFSVIPNGADMDSLTAASTEFRQNFGIETEFMLLSVGGYNERKNEAMLLDAFICAMPLDATLVFVGQERNRYTQALEQRWKDVSLSNDTGRVVFLDSLSWESVLSAYRAADLFLLGSKWECFPLVVLEAMAAGVPFIATDVGAVSELPGGVIVQNCTEMTRQIVSLLSSREARTRLGDAGVSACERMYNWKTIGSRYLELFRQMGRG